MNAQVRHFGHEVLRVRWMLVVAVAVLVARAYHIIPDESALALIFHKPALAAIGFVVAHVAYQQAFPYVDQGSLLRAAVNPQFTAEMRQLYAWLYAGTCLLRGVIYAAFVLAVAMGL